MNGLDVETFLAQVVIDGCSGMPLDDLQVLYRTADSISPRFILEIGASKGCSSMVLAAIAKKHRGIVQSIEYRPNPVWFDNIKKHSLSQYVQVIPHPSPWIDLNSINIPIDYLLIDGNHILRWALADYHYFSMFVRQGGLIAFHDCYTANNEVIVAIDIITKTDTFLEAIDWSDNGKGLIVFTKQVDHTKSWRHIWEKKRPSTLKQ